MATEQNSSIQRPEEDRTDENVQNQALQEFIADAAEIDDRLDYDENPNDSTATTTTEVAANKNVSELDETDADEDLKALDGTTATAEAKMPETVQGQEGKTQDTLSTTTETTTTAATTDSQSQTQAPAETQTSQTEDVVTDAQVSEVYKEWRGQTENLLADHHYALTQEQREELEIDPGKAIPRIMAKVYLDAVTASISQITTHLPRLVRLVNEQSRTMDKAEEAFYSKWDKLKGQEETVLRIGAAYRQANPRASQEQFINEVGAQAMVALRLDPGLTAPQQKQQTQQRQAFVPGATTPQTGAVARQTGNSGNVFSDLNDEFDMQEDMQYIGN